MNWTERYELAIHIVNKAFDGKKDLAGDHYTKHLERVKDKMDKHIECEIVALLHDLLEDCPEWNAGVLEQLFGEAVSQTVAILTKMPDDSYEDYINRVKESPWATRVKLADLEDNLNILRLPELRDKDIERIKKYHWAHKELSK